MSLDRRIRSILARLSGTTGGEAVAALAALERLLPANVPLSEVIFVGLHHMRQDVTDPSLTAEVRRLMDRLDEATRREEALKSRVDDLEGALRQAVAELDAARRALDGR